MANKARYYGISTREEQQDVLRKDKASRIYPQEFGYTAVVAAILNYKDENDDFNDFSSTLAASKIATLLTKTGLYGRVTNRSSRIIGDGYSVALTKGKELITINKKTEQTDIDEKRKKKK